MLYGIHFDDYNALQLDDAERYIEDMEDLDTSMEKRKGAALALIDHWDMKEFGRHPSRAFFYISDLGAGSAGITVYWGTSMIFAWDATRITALKKCPQYYEYAYRQGWRGKSKSVDLIFGGEFAKALEIFYHSGTLHDAVRHALAAPLPDTGAKSRETLCACVVGYLERYSKEETYVTSDGTVASELHFVLDVGELVLCGYLDRVVKQGDDLYVLDQKTTGRPLSDYYFAQYKRSDQMFMYSLVASKLLDSPISGVFIDSVRSEPREFRRSLVSFTEEQIDEWYSDTVDYIKANQGLTVQNVTSCYRCDFEPVCSSSPVLRGYDY